MVFGMVLTTGGTVDDVENWPADIAKVTARQVQEVAARYLNETQPWIRPPVTGYLLPADVPSPETELKNVQR